ncbi:uncharacterized protein LOC111339635 [Stylophora pistillata]|uniref:uncharacterized protein LOC111339635 n=1 Tax=Stylophora pistillata TaxID=50429 RepID=UPI000C056E6A|nr:uncharacterized protein LOC111339635 [Stylophora pistillata]
MKQAEKISSFPNTGDHIYVLRSLSYAHHGIYTRRNKVVHFQTPLETGQMDSSTIAESDFDKFLGSDGPDWYLYQYGVTEAQFSRNPRGTCTTIHSDDVTTVVDRAHKAIREGFGQFNIVGNNCEDFALYCKTGRRSQASGQYLSAMRRIEAARQAAATGYKSPIVYAGCVMGWFSAEDFENPKNMDQEREDPPYVDPGKRETGNLDPNTKSSKAKVAAKNVSWKEK